MIKAVFIDIDNTLLDFDRCSADSIRRSFEEWGFEFNEGVLDVFHEVNNSLWLKIEEKKLTKDGLYEVRWNTIFDRLGIVADGKLFEWTFKKYLAESHITVDGAEEILIYLKQKYIVCAASNGPHVEQYTRLEGAGLLKYFDYVFVSEDAGYEKPSEHFFEYCMSFIGDIGRKEVMMIGDSLTADIRGAKRFGLKTCFFDYHKRGDVISGSADYTVLTLDGVRKIL